MNGEDKQKKREKAKHHITLGDGLLEENLFHSAIEEYKKAVEIDPEFPEGYDALGILLYKRERYWDSIKIFERLIQIDDKYPFVHYNVGLCYLKQKKIEKAIDEFKKAISLDPDYPFPYWYLAKIFADEMNRDEALSYWRKFLELEIEDELAEEAKNILAELKSFKLPESSGRVSTFPKNPKIESPINIFYYPSPELANSSLIKLHWGVDSWKNIEDVEMKRYNDKLWRATIQCKEGTQTVEFCFFNEKERDNNDGKNWNILF